jgi:3-hydroxybenzoate 6-monooxygenase
MTNARNALPVAIAGGGIGGLAAALALARHGFRSLVLEQAREYGEVGVGLQVAPNALSVLDALGVGAAAKKHALFVERLVMMDAITGEEVVNIPCREQFRRRFGNPYAVAHRAHIHGPLLDACRASDLIELRTKARVTGFGLMSSNISVILDAGEQVPAQALIGADGIYSNVRKHIINDGDPLPVGAIIFRAIIPADEMPIDLQKSYPTFWAGPDWHIIYYPISDWSMFNLGCTVLNGQRTLADPEEFLPEAVMPYFTGARGIPERVLRIPKNFRRYAIAHREPVDNWSLGPATLLGDAAHPMVQYIAQGAAMALEDAICLGHVANECDGDFSQAFQRYQEIRIVRTARVQISSLMMDKLNHAKGVERKVRNYLFEGRTPEQYYDRIAWLYTPPAYVK